MAAEDLKAIIENLQKQGKMAFLEKTTPEKIEAFEKKNVVTLPEQYKAWLLYSDGGELFLPAGVQFYGIEHKPLMNVKSEDRPSDDYVVIGALASGDPILFKKNSEEVAIYNLEGGRIEDDEKYSDFNAFLIDLPSGILGIGD